MKRLTDEQSKVLEVSYASVSLNSGAGCGKTTVLTERYLRVASTHERGPAGVVALTFTEKAARELRGRVREACRLLDADDPDRALFRGLEAAPIGTFHSFCQRLLSRYPIEAGVEPEFAVLDEPIALSFRDRALDAAIRAWLSRTDDSAESEDLAALAVEYGLDRIRSALSRLIVRYDADEIRPWATRTPEEILDLWEARWQDEGCARLMRGFVAGCQESARVLVAYPCSSDKTRARIGSVLEILANLADHPDPAIPLEELGQLARVQGVTKPIEWPSAEAYEQIKGAMKSIREGSQKIKDRLNFRLDAALGAANLSARFARLAVACRDAYDAEKRSAGRLDFDDLLAETRRLLRENPGGISGLIFPDDDCLLVDEFQDTDPIQAEILDRLARDRRHRGALFLVGDAKQSIYRFRRAEPRIFGRYREAFPDEGRKDLTANFRSVPGLLDFVNALFAGTFPDDPPLVPGPGSAEDDGAPHVTFFWAHGDPGARHVPQETLRNEEARRLAGWLAERLGRGWPIHDRKTGGPRMAGPGDVVLLFKTLTDAAAYERELVRAGLDFHVVGGVAFFGQQEVIDVINLLAVLDDPLDGLSLASVLRSPFFSVSDEGLYWLARPMDDGGLGRLVAGFERDGHHPQQAAADRRKIDRARRLLRSWRELRDRLPMADLLDQALGDSGYEAALMAEPLAPRKRANVRKLVGKARQYDQQGGFTLGDLAARLREDLREPPREGEAATADEAGDCVRLMTIHQAKGLEFPIVVLPDLNRGVAGNHDFIAFHRDLGIVVRPSSENDVDPESDRKGGENLGWTLFDAIEKEEEYRESLRLFYVATTRAESHLVLSAGLMAGKPPGSPSLGLLEERFSLETGALHEPVSCEKPPRIEVVADAQPRVEPGEGKAGAAFDRLAMVALIRGAEARPAIDRPIPENRPGFLELDPSALLPPTAARLDRLVRALLSDARGWKDPSRLDDLAARIGQRQSPCAPRSLCERAANRVRLLMDREPGLMKGLARPGVERSVGWDLAWPADSARPTVIRASTDFVVPDRQGGWAVVLIADARVPEEAERLRLKLSALALPKIGFSPIVRGRIVRFEDDRIRTLDDIGFGPESVVRAWDEFLGDSATIRQVR
ncbi:MAG: UvrD-helicase domain-containing protein [Isosphaeraceae bacterium]